MLKRIQVEYVQAMKQKDKIKVSTLRMLKTAVTNRLKDTGASEENINQDEVIQIISKLLKQYKEELEFLTADTDKYNEIKQSIEILEGYLPKQLTSEEIQTAVDQLFEELPENQRNIGVMMKIIKERLGNQADMKAVSSLVKVKLG
jgi:hypothetical protein